MPKNDKRKFQGSNQQILGLDREFAVGDRICKRTLGGGLSLPNTPALKGAKHGVVTVSRKLSAPRIRLVSYRHVMQWDGRTHRVGNGND